jgi:hypothetical protein
MKNRIQHGQNSGRIQEGQRLGVEGKPEGEAEIEVARFGDAVLIRSRGRIVLRGGSMADRTEALEWMALFMPDAVTSLHG